MSTVDALSRPVRGEATAFRIINDEAVILNLDSGIYYSLNEVGSKVWDLCDGSRDIKDITTAVCQEFEVEREAAEKDVLELMDDLIKEGLISIHEHSASAKSD